LFTFRSVSVFLTGKMS